MYFKKTTIFVIFLIFFSPLSFFGVDENPFKNEWEVHSESITILDVDDVIEIVNKKDGILIDSYTKDVKPEKLDKKKWFPPKRYSIPGALGLPNIGREALTIEQRKYLETGLEKITKGNKDEKIIFFCRRGYYSKIAAERAVKLGYTNVSMFPGTDLWEDGGQRLVILKEQIFN